MIAVIVRECLVSFGIADIPRFGIGQFVVQEEWLLEATTV